MSLQLDSTPVFRARAKQFGLDTIWNRFEERGWVAYGDFAFSNNWVPGSQNDEDFTKKVVVGLLGEPPTDEDAEAKKAYEGKSVKLRRLFVESFTIFTADQHRKINVGEDEDKPRKLAKEERAERLQLIKTELSNLELDKEPELIPSYKLTDTFVSMKDSGDLRPIPWDEVTTRSQEKRAIKKDPMWSLNGQGKLLMTQAPDGVHADTSSEARIRFLLQRRGVALQMARLASWRAHQKIVRLLMSEYTRDQPEGFAPVTIHQIHTADKEIFLAMSELTEAGLETEAPGTYPLDDVIEKVLNEPRIKALLNPFPSARGGGSNSSGSKRENESQMMANLKSENKRLKMGQNQQGGRMKMPGGKGAKGKGSKAGKGGEKNKDSGTRMPKELIGLRKESGGKNFCYAFNLEGCPEGRDCKKGEHKCMKCGSSSHGFRQCKE